MKNNSQIQKAVKLVESITGKNVLLKNKSHSSNSKWRRLNEAIDSSDIEEFLKGLETEIDILNYVNIDDIEYEDAFESIFEMISDNGGFDVEIIGYRSAIQYLAKEDVSLRTSLELASDLGYEARYLNSETLASILKSEIVREEFYELEQEINDFFSTTQNEY